MPGHRRRHVPGLLRQHTSADACPKSVANRLADVKPERKTIKQSERKSDGISHWQPDDVAHDIAQHGALLEPNAVSNGQPDRGAVEIAYECGLQ